jgi:hypothetical protein
MVGCQRGIRNKKAPIARQSSPHAKSPETHFILYAIHGPPLLDALAGIAMAVKRKTEGGAAAVPQKKSRAGTPPSADMISLPYANGTQSLRRLPQIWAGPQTIRPTKK